jgi:hypothetical protein
LNGTARVCFEHEPKRATLPVEGRQELDAAVGRRQHAVNEMLQRRIVSIGGVRHARFEVPARTVIVAQPRALGAGPVLDASSAERYFTQQIRTWNKGHRVFL